MPAWLQLMIDSFGPCSGRGLFYRAADPDYLRAGNRARLVGGAGQIIWSGPLVMLVRFYVWLIRGTPLLVQLFLIFTVCRARA